MDKLVKETGVPRENHRPAANHCSTFIITTTYAINTYHHNVVNSNPAHEEVYSIQHYVIMLNSDLRQVGGFLWVLQFPLPVCPFIISIKVKI
jgi:hypothetical protein